MGEKINNILRKLKRKSKKLVKDDIYTEFFYFNKNRRIIEFLEQDGVLVMETFFKKFIQKELSEFIRIKILNDNEEEIKNWYFEEEDLVILISINWGNKKQEISVDISIDNFITTIINSNKEVFKEVDYNLLNSFIISFLELRSKNISLIYNRLKN